VIAQERLTTICRKRQAAEPPGVSPGRMPSCSVDPAVVGGRRLLLISFTSETTAARRSGIKNTSINLRHIGHQPAPTKQKHTFSRVTTSCRGHAALALSTIPRHGNQSRPTGHLLLVFARVGQRGKWRRFVLHSLFPFVPGPWLPRLACGKTPSWKPVKSKTC
jgi:hypothetical protein